MRPDDRDRRLFVERYQELLKSTAPGWVKRGAYRYLLHYLPIDHDDLFGTQELLKSVGIEATDEQVEDFCEDLAVGIEHIEEILDKKLMSKAWKQEDNLWF